jgi:2-oxoisovalerate dehydrogenase E2 component (dihydrolipoyl transacylase)
VEVLAWHVAPGDRVAQFDKLLDVQSDKATVDITSRYDGIIRKLNYKVGDMAPTGKPLLDIELSGEGGDDAPAAAAAHAPPSASSAAASTAAEPDDDAHPYAKALATPAVRRIAREHGVGLERLRGSGKDGRVTKEDVLKFVAAGGDAEAGGAASAAKAVAAAAPNPAKAAPSSAVTAGADADTIMGKAPAASLAPLPPPPSVGVPADSRRPIRGLQKAMVKSMSAAWSVPHFGYSDEVTMDALIELRAAVKPLAEARGVKFSYMPLILKATSMALKAFPHLNAALSPDGAELILRGAHNIGVAMDTPRGLIVPNVKAVQERSVLDIAHELTRLQGLAAAGKLGDADLADGTFTYVGGGWGCV